MYAYILYCIGHGRLKYWYVETAQHNQVTRGWSRVQGLTGTATVAAARACDDRSLCSRSLINARLDVIQAHIHTLSSHRWREQCN